MNIEISKKSDGSFIADCTDLCGSPPMGTGHTKDEALGNLLRKVSKEIIGNTGLTWLQKYFTLDINIIENEPEPVAEDLWETITFNTENW